MSLRTLLVAAGLMVTLSGNLEAVGSTHLGQLCPTSDPFCTSAEVWCFECEVRPDNSRRCRSVSGTETGYQNCDSVFNGTYGTSCTVYGTFCSWITVNP
jgi:hypothetical protein